MSLVVCDSVPNIMAPGSRFGMNKTPTREVALVDEFAKLPSETSWVEFKVNNYRPELIGTLISAISNAARLNDERCGYVVWGIDNSHNIVGTKFQPAAEMVQDQPLEFWLARRLSPSINFRFKDVHHTKGRLVMLEIPAAEQVTTKFENIAYLRIGQTTPKLADFPVREAALLSKLKPFVWESGVARAFVQSAEVIKLLDIAAYFTLGEQPVPNTDDGICSILAHDKILFKDVGGRWDISNLGAILFAKDIAEFDNISRKAMRVIEHDTGSRATTIKERSGKLGYAAGFEGLIEYINKRLPRREVIGRALRVPQPVYPEIAIRELVANALIHQDFAISGAGPVVDIFPDRVEVSNPGAPLVETRRLIDFPPRSRNETMAALLRRLGMCEEQGSGIDKVIIAAEEGQLAPPDFQDEGYNMRATLFARKTFGAMSQEERVRGCYQHCVIRYLANQGMTNSTLRQRFGVAERNASQISRVIKQTQEAGLIKPSDVWSSRGGHYLPSWASKLS